MAPVVNLGGTYVVPPNITSETLTHLRRHAATEAACFWLGTLVHGKKAVVLTVWVPKFAATAVSYEIEPMEMLRLKNNLDSAGLGRLAQVHSHPGRAFHSRRDDLNSASPWPGFISIVIPNGGRIPGGFC